MNKVYPSLKNTGIPSSALIFTGICIGAGVFNCTGIPSWALLVPVFATRRIAKPVEVVVILPCLDYITVP
jgi:hypothetical protein